MFGFGKKKQAPPLCPGNPGQGEEVQVALSNGSRSWTETVNLVQLAVAVFKKHGHKIKDETTWLHHTGSGFLIQPQLVEIQPLEDSGMRTVTTIQINHPTLAPNGVFEYQHSTGNTVAQSISWGFDQWLQTDFVTLLDALRPKPESCMTLEMAFPAKDDQPERLRRAVLGPVAHFMENRPEEATETSPEDHPFCSCCMLTQSIEAFRDLLEGKDFYGLRLFASRDQDGNSQADCRVNGEDYEPGAEALRAYVQTWPAAGFEFRKQYVILQTIHRENIEEKTI